MWGATVQMQAAGTFPEPDTIPDTIFAVHHLISEYLFAGQICIMAILKMSKLHLGCLGHLLGLPCLPQSLYSQRYCHPAQSSNVPPSPKKKRDFNFILQQVIKCFHSCGPKGYVDSWVNLDKVTRNCFSG